MRSLAEGLAQRCQVLIWDRRNCGASDVFFGGQGSEQHIWADDLAELLRRLDLAPAWIGGGSAGARCSILTALRHPDVVRGLLLWQVTGGPKACQNLGYNYHVPFEMAALSGGMEAVAQSPFFAERIAANPANRDRLLAMDPEEFARVMRRWNTFFYHRQDTPVIGASESDLATISKPALVFDGNDVIHPREASDAVLRLVPGAKRVPAVWSGDEFMDHYVGRATGGVMETLWPRMAQPLLAYLAHAGGAGGLSA